MSEGRRSLLVFVGGCLASLLTMCIWMGTSFYDLGTPPEQVKASDLCVWVFVFPAAATQHLNLQLSITLVLLNPLIYGGLWWFTWRMWKLVRAKPAE